MTTWQDLVQGNFVGGDLVFRNDEWLTLGGPIKAITLDEEYDMITFTLEWIAILDEEVGEWATAPSYVAPCFNFLASWAIPPDIGSEPIHFSFPPMITSAEATLFPLGRSKLDKTQVSDRIYDPLAV
jgi:hypothetical protein